MPRPASSSPKVMSLSRQVINIIGEKIVSGEFAVGENLPNEDELQTEFDVSRTVIREAIKVLTDKGLLEVRTRRGTRVRPSSDWNLLDPDVLLWQANSGPTHEFLTKIVEVRRSIEVSASELAAIRATDDDIATIKERYEILAKSVHDSDEYIDADVSFHESIFKACHNEFFEQLAILLRLALQSSRKISVQIPGGPESTLHLHYNVVEAIVNRDVDAAGDATRKLVDRSMEDIEKVLQEIQRNQ